MPSISTILKYAFIEITSHYDDKFWWHDRFLHRVVGPFQTTVYPRRQGAISVIDEDWDTLLVLDACRLDLFEETVDIDQFDEYDAVTSRGSATKEWVIQNFADAEFGDTVYVTANPYVSREAPNSFYELYEPWIDGFDRETKTVLPETVANTARKAIKEHPNKRLIVHFMQPHHPFIGTPELQYQGWQIEEFDEWSKHKEERHSADRNRYPTTPWEALYRGEASRQSVWAAYRENLRLVMDEAVRLLEEFEGKTVLTSDHGNMLGERTWPIPLRVYGHPSGIRSRELVRVPWATRTNGPRRDIRAETVTSRSESDEQELEQRLKDLGYT